VLAALEIFTITRSPFLIPDSAIVAVSSLCGLGGYPTDTAQRKSEYK
jgi:hypothetical protein